MKHIRFSIIIIFINILFVQTNNAQWVQQKNGLPDNWGIGWAIDACDSMTAVFLVNMVDQQPDAVYFTTDGGNNWKNISPFKSWGETAIDVSVIDKDNIWLVTSAEDSARILHTMNGGETWTVQFNDPSKTKFFNYIEMFDLNNGIAMGDGIEINDFKVLLLKTENSGETWSLQNSSGITGWSMDTWRKIDFISPNIGYFLLSNSSLEGKKFYKTIDSGNNWTKTNFTSGAQVLKFFNERNGLVYRQKYVGTTFLSGEVLRTNDGGDSWIANEMQGKGWGNDIEFLPNDATTVWLTDYSNMYLSIDSGKTWIKNNIYDGELEGRDIYFSDQKHGWLLCDNGKLFYTNNNGGLVTDIKKRVNNNKLPQEFKLSQNYPNPFNPSTTIKYSIPSKSVMLNSFQHLKNSEIPKQVRDDNANVSLKVYDILGREIATLVNQKQKPGNYEVNFDASKLSSGVYYYTFKAGGNLITRKMILLK